MRRMLYHSIKPYDKTITVEWTGRGDMKKLCTLTSEKIRGSRHFAAESRTQLQIRFCCLIFFVPRSPRQNG